MRNRGAVLRRISELAHENLTQKEFGPDYRDIEDKINELIIDICNKNSLTGVEQIGKKQINHYYCKLNHKLSSLRNTSTLIAKVWKILGYAGEHPKPKPWHAKPDKKGDKSK